MSEQLYDADRRPVRDTLKDHSLYSEAMIFTGSRRWVMMEKNGIVSPVRTKVRYGENSYSAIKREIFDDAGIGVATGAVIFTGLFRGPGDTGENLVDIWVFRLNEKDGEISSPDPGIRIVTSDEIRDHMENGSYSDLGETQKIDGIMTICETPVCVDF